MKKQDQDMMLLRMAIEKQLTERKRKIDLMEMFVKCWIGLFLIAGFLGIILLTALLIIHPFSLMIIFIFLGFVISVKAIMRSLNL